MKEEKREKVGMKLVASIYSIALTAIVASSAVIIVYFLLPKYSRQEEEEPAKA